MYERISTRMRIHSGATNDFLITIRLQQLSSYLFTLVLNAKAIPRCTLFANDIVLLKESERVGEGIYRRLES